MEGEEPTQATQNVLDPRRLGKQNSGFSDEDISDILCVLHPNSAGARTELQRLAQENSPYIIGRDEADGVEPNYDLEDDAARFESHPTSHGNYALILRLSARLKNQSAGFAFGRNAARCDVVFSNDPKRRVSNIHFRIYVNEYGNVMVEDQSTNGTWIDKKLLLSHAKDSKDTVNKWVITSGSVVSIYLHEPSRDLKFLVRIPRRDEYHAEAYLNNVEEYFARHGLQGYNQTIGPGPSGHVDLFGQTRQAPAVAPVVPPHLAPNRHRDRQAAIKREWNGSGVYNRQGMIGKGAFAVVYMVTSKYDGKPYAAKELEKRKFMKNGVVDQKVENEMKIMKRVKHPNIVQFIDHIDWEDRLLIIIMEYVPHGDLGKQVAEKGPLPEEKGQVMARQLLNALAYLHTNKITHRDVKPDNILISSHDPLEVKLTDFGLSKMVETEQTFLRTFCGTLLYCAPEVYTEFTEYDMNGIRSRGKKMRRMPGQRYDHAVDIWSLGGVLFYSLTALPPYPTQNGTSHSELLHRIMTTELDTRPLGSNGVSSFGIDYIHAMLQRRPEVRATVETLDAHPWLNGVGDTIAASQSYDVITDDEEEFDGQVSQSGQAGYEEDRVSDSIGDDSDQESYTHRQQAAAGPRLFGEVGSSALGSSGAIPEDLLNLHAADTSMDGTEIMGLQGNDNVTEIGDSRSAGERTYRHYVDTNASLAIAANQSADQLQSLVENVASQSLGDHENGKQNRAAVPPHLSTNSLDFNSSKRKPPLYDTSEEYDENTPPGKPEMKRLKSDGLYEVPSDAIDEYKLLARMPQIQKLGSGRQIDSPVYKVEFWKQDRSTWHLQYPEMTQLQCDAFSQAARERGEEFGLGKTPLWALAMKYFPPSLRPPRNGHNGTSGTGVSPDPQDTYMANGVWEPPPTAPPPEGDSIPDTAPADTRIVPIQPEEPNGRVLGMIESHEDSCIKTSFPIADSLVSFGRGPENTQVFEPKTESRVPKYAFKIILWKEGYDPSKDPSKTQPPWAAGSAEDPSSYSFWISTKASVGIHINGYVLPSSDSKNPSSPSQNWERLRDGDELLIWGSPDPGKSLQSKLIFRCMWGGSSQPRGADKKLDLADSATSQKIDAACAKTEKRVREAAEKRRKVDEAKAEQFERVKHVDRERESSRRFEAKRQEAIEYLQARNLVSSRRDSPAGQGLGHNATMLNTTTTVHSRMLTTQISRLSPDKEPGQLLR